MEIAQASGAAAGTLCQPLYVRREKILSMHETLRKDWLACSTSGYDFFNILNGLFVEAGNCWFFTCFYCAQTQDLPPFADVVYDEMVVRRVH